MNDSVINLINYLIRSEEEKEKNLTEVSYGDNNYIIERKDKEYLNYYEKNLKIFASNDRVIDIKVFRTMDIDIQRVNIGYDLDLFYNYYTNKLFLTMSKGSKKDKISFIFNADLSQRSRQIEEFNEVDKEYLEDNMIINYEEYETFKKEEQVYKKIHKTDRNISKEYKDLFSKTDADSMSVAQKISFNKVELCRFILNNNFEVVDFCEEDSSKTFLFADKIINKKSQKYIDFNNKVINDSKQLPFFSDEELNEILANLNIDKNNKLIRML